MSTDTFEHPLQGRYASDAMKRLWSDDRKFGLWRTIWTAVVRLLKEMNVIVGGEPIRDEQIEEMERARTAPIDYASARRWEKSLRHDVMAHVRTFAEACPSAAPLIHFPLTSCDPTDNADLITIREGLKLIAAGIARVIQRLSAFARTHRARPALGYTHFQAASLTTVGKRACLWIQDLLEDLTETERLIRELRFRGLKGATGTQDTLLELFDGDHEKVKELDRRFAAAFGFERFFRITGQTYTRQQDTAVLQVLASLAVSAKKMATDLRLLAHEKEIEEPFEEEQVGSSAMPYKRNPMRSERACSLARYLMNLAPNALQTHAEQWLERSLDDSANRRLIFPEAFLAADAILLILQNVSEGLVVYPRVIARHVAEELPFMAVEKILVAIVKAGGDRQEVHERLRVMSQKAGRTVKEMGELNDLVARIKADPFFAPIHVQLGAILDPSRFIGRAPEQVDEFLAEEVEPALARYAGKLGGSAELNV